MTAEFQIAINLIMILGLLVAGNLALQYYLYEDGLKDFKDDIEFVKKQKESLDRAVRMFIFYLIIVCMAGIIVLLKNVLL